MAETAKGARPLRGGTHLVAGLAAAVLGLGAAAGPVHATPAWEPGRVLTSYSPSPSGDWSGAFADALQAIAADGGGVLLVPAGSYRIDSPVVLPADGIAIAGEGPATTITNGRGMPGGMIQAVGRSAIGLRDLRFETDPTRGTTPAFHLSGGSSGLVTDIRVERVEVVQRRGGAGGCVITSRGADLERVTVRDLVVRGEGDPRSSTGLIVGAGPATARDILVERVIVDGFRDGFDTNHTGFLVDATFRSCTFRNASRYGARFYHVNALQVRDCLFDQNDYGAWLTHTGPDWQPNIVSGCRFTRNRSIGAYTEQWRSSVMSNCVFAENLTGFWCASGQESLFEGCVFNRNLLQGCVVDRAGATGTTIPNPSYLRDITFAGCTFSLNGTDGLVVNGVQRSCVIAGCTITRNGQGGFVGHPAALRIGRDQAGTTPGHVVVRGCVLGTPSGLGGANGNEDTGLAVTSSIASLRVIDCELHNLAMPIVATAGGAKVVEGCFLRGCGPIVVTGGPPGTPVVRNNVGLAD